MTDPECTGRHHYFVAETGIDAHGHIIVICICTACGEPLKHEFTVESSTDFQLQNKNKKE